MKSNIRHTFRPTLDVLEDRLVPSYSWGIVYTGDAVAVLTAAQPAPALSSFNWGVGAQPAGWNIIQKEKNMPTAAQPAPALSSFQWGIGRGIDALAAAQPAPASPPAAVQDLHFTGTPSFSEAVATATPSIILKRIVGGAQPVDQISINFTKVE
jgi:hypothetical protein